MNATERRRIACAPELAVIHALRAAADATCAAIAAAHPFADAEPISTEEILAIQLCDSIVRLQRKAADYCDYVNDLPQLGLFPPLDPLP